MDMIQTIHRWNCYHDPSVAYEVVSTNDNNNNNMCVCLHAVYVYVIII